jgi:hypothetical protein
MINNGVMFGGEGPLMQGTWYNPHTGDAFTVRDSFFEDNQYLVMTTDGRRLYYNQLQNYIQSDMKLEDLKKTRINKPTKSEPAIPAEVAQLIDGNDPYSDMMLEDDILITQTKPIGNIYSEERRLNLDNQNIINSPVMTKPQSVNMNTTIIEKALKNASKPAFKVFVAWDPYPSKEIEMLKDIMEISEDEIIDWYLNNIQMTDVVESLKEGIKAKFSKGDVEMVVPVSPAITIEELKKTEEKPAKTTKKKTVKS